MERWHQHYGELPNGDVTSSESGKSEKNPNLHLQKLAQDIDWIHNFTNCTIISQRYSALYFGCTLLLIISCLILLQVILNVICNSQFAYLFALSPIAGSP